MRRTAPQAIYHEGKKSSENTTHCESPGNEDRRGEMKQGTLLYLGMLLLLGGGFEAIRRVGNTLTLG